MSEPAKLIIHVDDDADYLDINKQILESAGYEVQSFVEPEEALAYMADRRPALVISDLMMKTLDSGFTFSRQIKERHPGVPVIIMTAVGSRRGFDFKPRSAQDMAAMNIDAFFDKSVDADTLLAKVRELLSRRSEASK
jgi:DNA-binding NtrC family response regulator